MAKPYFVSWEELESIKLSTNMPFYYTTLETTPSNKYLVVMSTQLFQAEAVVKAAADVTDFETNYKSGATSTTTQDGARALSAVTVVNAPVPTSKSDMVHEYASHGQSNASESTMLSYTVTAGKTFYLIRYIVQKDDDNLKKAKFTLEVDGTIKDSGYSLGDTTNIFLNFEPKHPIPFANGGEDIDFKIKPSGNPQNKTWSVTLVGYEI